MQRGARRERLPPLAAEGPIDARQATHKHARAYIRRKGMLRDHLLVHPRVLAPALRKAVEGEASERSDCFVFTGLEGV